VTAVRTLLVANRGEIACRVIRTAREMGIRTVAVFTGPDAGAPHVRAADVAVPLGEPRAYLSVDALLEAARVSGADAVHPGYGFLSENAAFAAACAAAGLVFVGPSPEAMREMGLKHRAKELARKAGVPVLPDAVLESDDRASWASSAEDVGFPLLVKASAGGGGRGMRLVTSPSELAAAVESARREAASSFGDPLVFLERYLATPRHVEVQVFGDSFGNVIHLGERECSIQRRHQKVVEESPSPAVTPGLRAEMGATACALASSLGYVGAGTIEFLLDGEAFYFLEMNTRLQVEHPVTEAVTGLDLVRLQLMVARGEALPVSSLTAPTGHAIEVRLYAEDPASDFAPTFGPLWRYAHAAVPGVRYDDGVATGSEVSTFYDPMLSKVVAHAGSRDEAAARLALALEGMHLHGPGTNRDFLVRVLRDPDFLAGATATDFVPGHSALLASPAAPLAHLAAVVATSAFRRRDSSDVAAFAPSGWRLFPSAGQRVVLTSGATAFEVEYSLGDGLRLVVDGTSHELDIAGLTADRVRVTVDGLESGCDVHHAPDGTVWVNDGTSQSSWREEPRFPAPLSAAAARGPVSEVPGTVVAVHVAAGDTVAEGQLLLVLEAMKMEHRITAPRDGVVAAVRVGAGDFVDAHEVLVTMED